jgi:predicted transcriptional regulator
LLELKTKRRDQLSVVASIIEAARMGILKTQIMYKANLSFTQLDFYVTRLLRNGLIAHYFAGHDMYITTKKGLRFLQQYRELVKLLDESKEKGKQIILI